jgi:hypothetical protein
VTLPNDPLWKRDYAASFRRLIRDGVDTPLATLFVTALGRFLLKLRASIARGAHPKHFSIDAWKLWQRREDDSR